MQIGLLNQPAQLVRPQSCHSLMIDALAGGRSAPLHHTEARMVVVKLSLDAPGLPQLLDLVERYQPSREIHLVCPGQDDRIMLGTTAITLRDLRQDRRVRTAFIELGRLLATEVDLVLGGANVGRGQAGQEFLQTLADLLQVEVSALVRISPSTWPLDSG